MYTDVCGSPGLHAGLRLGRAIWSCCFALAVFSSLSDESRAAAAFVQVNNTSPLTTVTSVSATYNLAQFPGDTNVVFISWEDSAGSILSVIDTAGNPYSLAVGPTTRAGIAAQSIYYAKNILSSAPATNTVTVTFAAGEPHPDLRIVEYSGIDTSSPLDVARGSNGSSSSTTSGAATTTNANDLLVGGNVVSNVTTGAGAGYTSRVITSHGDIVEDMSVSATGSYSATAPQSPAGWYVMQMAAFKATSASPYPLSPILGGISWNYTTKTRLATGSQCTSCGAGPGSDIWDSTWASDNFVYSAWGDGSGFNSTTQQYQIGISQLSGTPSGISGTDVSYGSPKGTCVVTPAGAVGGKPAGLVALPSATLYMFHSLSQVSIGGVCGSGVWLSKSTNLGSATTFTDHVGSLAWPDANGFSPSAVLQYGPGQQGALAPTAATTAYIYIYGHKASISTGTYLARVPASPSNSIETLSNWSYFGGMVNGLPQWVTSSANAAPVFYDPNNQESLGVTFDAAMGRYLAYNDHGIPTERQVSLFDAPSPWGPWTTFDYEENFDNAMGCSPCLANGSGVGFSMMQKYFGSDGLSMWPIYSSDQNGYDSLNLVKGTMTLASNSTVSGLSISTHTPAVLDRLSTSPPGNIEYIDRTYQLTSIPAAYQGLESIRLANNDKTASSAQTYVSFTNTVQQSVCVGWDTANALPPWIDGTWTNTHNQLIGNATFNVYSKVFSAGSVSLSGANSGDVFILFVGC